MAIAVTTTRMDTGSVLRGVRRIAKSTRVGKVRGRFGVHFSIPISAAGKEGKKPLSVGVQMPPFVALSATAPFSAPGEEFFGFRG